MLAFFVLGILTFLSMGYGAIVIGVITAVFGLIGFHYIVWGWWLGRILREEAEAEDAP